MSGEPIHIQLNATGVVPSSFPVVLKKIMEMPPPNILDGDEDTDKEKLALGGPADLGGGGSDMGPSAALTPAIWDKTIPYDGESFHLEYMDLDEFLLENGIPVSLDEEELQKTLASVEGKGKCIPKLLGLAAAVTSTPTPAPATPAAEVPAPTPAPDPSPTAATSEPEEPVTVTTLQPAKLEEDEDEEEQEEEAVPKKPPAKAEVKRTDCKPTACNTSSPVDPDAIEVDINFQPDPTDLVLSSVPGGELFNPRKHKFSDEELKPQPMIKKAKKVFVPDEQKDEKYWSRRKKNNLAAKRSRDARRLKENQITVRASFLERENAALRQQVAELRKDCGRCKNILARYEAKYGPL
uniref:Thyrotroph embryonic factor b n=3 Tax=Nothobranchius TaxID=28779 RepID=A0A1A8RR71_9TELE